MNAQRTLAELQRLNQLQFSPVSRLEFSEETPAAILSQFAALETDGRGLTPDGIKQLESFLVAPPSWQRDKVHVAKDFVVSDAAFLGSKGTLYVEYIALGDLDSSLRLTTRVPSGIKVREDYTLVLSNLYSLPGVGGKAPQEVIGPSRWRIEASTAEQWISLDAAIRCVTQMREAATDPVLKANADKTLAILARYR
jgi:hypothetical protein